MQHGVQLAVPGDVSGPPHGGVHGEVEHASSPSVHHRVGGLDGEALGTRRGETGVEFDLNNAVGDVAWSPNSLTTFAAVTSAVRCTCSTCTRTSTSPCASRRCAQGEAHQGGVQPEASHPTGGRRSGMRHLAQALPEPAQGNQRRRATRGYRRRGSQGDAPDEKRTTRRVGVESAAPDPERAYRRYSSTIATRSKQNHRSGSSLLNTGKTTQTRRDGRRGRPEKILRSLSRPEGSGTRVVSPSSPSDDRRPLARWVHTRIRRRRGRLSAKWAPRPATRPWKRPSTTRPSTRRVFLRSPPAGAPPSRWTPRRTPPCPPRRGIGGSTGGPSPPCCGISLLSSNSTFRNTTSVRRGDLAQFGIQGAARAHHRA